MMRRLYPQRKKKCVQCKEVKSHRLFYQDKQKKDGLMYHCRDCHRKRTIEERERNSKRYKRYHSEYYLKWNKRIKELNDARYRRIMTELFELLNNRCVICGEKDKRILGVDHINGGGNKERKIKGNSYTYYTAMTDSIKRKENKYRLLCSNCNLREAFNKGFKKTIWK